MQSDSVLIVPFVKCCHYWTLSISLSCCLWSEAVCLVVCDLFLWFFIGSFISITFDRTYFIKLIYLLLSWFIYDISMGEIFRKQKVYLITNHAQVPKSSIMYANDCPAFCFIRLFNYYNISYNFLFNSSALLNHYLLHESESMTQPGSAMANASLSLLPFNHNQANFPCYIQSSDAQFFELCLNFMIALCLRSLDETW